MDDSERSYGYSEDIYHGQHDRKDEKSYEYGAEDPEEVQGEELSPEEQAIHIEGSHKGEEPVASGEAGAYDYGRQGLWLLGVLHLGHPGHRRRAGAGGLEDEGAGGRAGGAPGRRAPGAGEEAAVALRQGGAARRAV